MTRALRRLPALETVLLVAATLVLVAAAVLRERARSNSVALDSFSTYDANSGGYRALYELLEREGVRVERFARRPAFLNASFDTLVWAEPLAFDPHATQATRADVAALETWVRAGGRLLYVGHDDAAARQGILRLPASRSVAAGSGNFAVARSLRAAGVTRVLSASALRWQPSHQRVRTLVYDRAGALVLAYALGRGSVVAVIDEQAFTNVNIARGQQARLAYALARPARAGGWVAFDEAVHGYAVPEHWWSIVPRPLGAALALAGLALLAALSGAAMRLGPPLRPVPRTDRSSADFIDAASALLERGAASATALNDAANSTRRALARALGLREETPDDDIVARIEGAGERVDFVDMLAAARDARPSETAFIRGVARAQRLRKEFSAHGPPRY